MLARDARPQLALEHIHNMRVLTVAKVSPARERSLCLVVTGCGVFVCNVRLVLHFVHALMQRVEKQLQELVRVLLNQHVKVWVRLHHAHNQIRSVHHRGQALPNFPTWMEFGGT